MKILKILQKDFILLFEEHKIYCYKILSLKNT